jgi:hypothetical protein
MQKDVAAAHGLIHELCSSESESEHAKAKGKAVGKRQKTPATMSAELLKKRVGDILREELFRECSFLQHISLCSPRNISGPHNLYPQKWQTTLPWGATQTKLIGMVARITNWPHLVPFFLYKPGNGRGFGNMKAYYQNVFYDYIQDKNGSEFPLKFYRYKAAEVKDGEPFVVMESDKIEATPVFPKRYWGKSHKMWSNGTYDGPGWEHCFCEREEDEKSEEKVPARARQTGLTKQSVTSVLKDSRSRPVASSSKVRVISPPRESPIDVESEDDAESAHESAPAPKPKKRRQNYVTDSDELEDPESPPISARVKERKKKAEEEKSRKKAAAAASMAAAKAARQKKTEKDTKASAQPQKRKQEVSQAEQAGSPVPAEKLRTATAMDAPSTSANVSRSPHKSPSKPPASKSTQVRSASPRKQASTAGSEAPAAAESSNAPVDVSDTGMVTTRSKSRSPAKARPSDVHMEPSTSNPSRQAPLLSAAVSAFFPISHPDQRFGIPPVYKDVDGTDQELRWFNVQFALKKIAEPGMPHPSVLNFLKAVHDAYPEGYKIPQEIRQLFQ